jgi:hypothetical protein
VDTHRRLDESDSDAAVDDQTEAFMALFRADFMATLPGTPKLKALKTGDRLALTIDADAPPHHVLSIRGTADVTRPEGVVQEYAKAAVRYLGKEQGEAHTASLPQDIRTGWCCWASRPGSSARWCGCSQARSGERPSACTTFPCGASTPSGKVVRWRHRRPTLDAGGSVTAVRVP